MKKVQIVIKAHDLKFIDLTDAFFSGYIQALLSIQRDAEGANFKGPYVKTPESQIEVTMAAAVDRYGEHQGCLGYGSLSSQLHTHKKKKSLLKALLFHESLRAIDSGHIKTVADKAKIGRLANCLRRSWKK